MTKQSFYPFRSEIARAEYAAYAAERVKAWPVACETMLIDTPSGQTFVRASGRINDPPLILLPGVRVGSLMWIDTIAALSAHHRTYALDIIGDVGFSVSRRKISKPEQFVTWLDEVLTVLVPEEPHWRRRRRVSAGRRDWRASGRQQPECSLARSGALR